MDLIAVGKFLKEQRKAKNLTQYMLAEKLGVSEKTVSKWECGNGFPDVSLVLLICKELDISANELLSGEKIESKNYKQQAEQTLIKQEHERQHATKLLLGIEIVLGVISVLFLIGTCLVVSFVLMALWLKIVVMVFGFCVFLFGLHFCIIIEKDAGYYECKHCNHKHIPKLKDIYWSLHIGRTRLLKCPNCKKTSWQKKVIK